MKFINNKKICDISRCHIIFERSTIIVIHTSVHTPSNNRSEVSTEMKCRERYLVGVCCCCIKSICFDHDRFGCSVTIQIMQILLLISILKRNSRCWMGIGTKAEHKRNTTALETEKCLYFHFVCVDSHIIIIITIFDTHSNMPMDAQQH